MTNCACRRCGRSPSPTAWFMQNGWPSAVDSTADFLNSVQRPPFDRVTGNDGFCSKSLFAIWWNIKINLQKLVNICRYELPTNLRNFMQKDLKWKWKYSKKFFWGMLLFSETPCMLCTESCICLYLHLCQNVYVIDSYDSVQWQLESYWFQLGVSLFVYNYCVCPQDYRKMVLSSWSFQSRLALVLGSCLFHFGPSLAKSTLLGQKLK